MTGNDANHLSEKYPLLYDALYCPDDVQSEFRAMRHARWYRRALWRAMTFSPLAIHYLGSRLHDSRVLSVERERDTFVIWLDDFDTRTFVDALCDHFHVSIPRKNCSMPVGLRFQGLRQLRVSRVNRNLKLLPLSTARFLPLLDEFLYDEARILEPDRIELGMVFTSKNRASSRKNLLLLEVSSSLLEITELQKPALDALFPNDHSELVEKFWADRHNGIPFDYSSSMSFIRQYESQSSLSKIQKEQSCDSPRWSSSQSP